jgi:hypothetical protein
MGLADAVLGVVMSIIFIAVGIIIIWALYPINPFIAVVGVVLLIILAIAVVLGFIRSMGD